jgi:hypothetical protein
LFSGEGIDKTASAGLVLLASAIAAAALYSIYGAYELVRRTRAERARPLAQAERASAESVVD